MEKPYWQQRRDLKNGAPPPKKKEVKDLLKKFYEAQAAIAPENCENCGASLLKTILAHPRGHIAHIVAKGGHGCPSVDIDMNNAWFACEDCHALYDGPKPEIIATMKIIPTLRKRLKLFYDKIAQNERRRIPGYLLSR